MIVFFILGAFAFIGLVHLVRATNGHQTLEEGTSPLTFFEDAERLPKSGLDLTTMHYDPTNPYYTGRLAPRQGSGVHPHAFSEPMDKGFDDSISASFVSDVHDAGGGLDDSFHSHH